MLVSRIKKGSVPHFLAILFLVTMVSLISLTKVEAVVSREQGLEIVIKKIVGEETEKVNIWAYPTTLTNYAEIKTPKGSIFSPYEESWFFFVDDHPFENWEHPCRYVLVDRETGEFTVAHNRMLPKDASSLELLVRCEVPKPELPIKGSGSRSEPLMTDPDPHKYAVLINGGYHLITNFTRFWNDLSAMYTTLVQHYGYMDENIYVLCSDGTNPAVDQTDYTGHVNPETGEPYFNSDPDLDQDGDPDIDYAATRANVYIVFQELQNILTASDELFVFITPHGGAEEQEDESLIYLWEQTELTDDELADLVAPISCSDMIFVILSCHSGGFIDDLSSKPHRVISTACKWEEESRPEIWYTWFGFDEFAYYWTAAVRGYYPYYDEDYWGPDDGWPLPWLEGDPIVESADDNGDGNVSMWEAFEFANYCDTWSEYGFRNPHPRIPGAVETPQYADTPVYNGDILHLAGRSGKLSVNQSWLGYYVITGNVTVPSDIILSIGTGTTLDFTGYFKLTVNGTISATGTSGNRVTFTNSSGTWGGIDVTGSAASSSVLNYCTIENVLTYGSAALRIQNCSPTVQNCILSYMQNYGTTGVYIYNGSPTLYNNTVTNNGGNGIYLNSSNGYIYCNTIQSNGSAGIRCYSYASPSLGKPGYYPGSNNVVSDNVYGVRASTHSHPYVGSEYSSWYRNNSLLNNTSANLYATNYSDVFAELVWWGSNDPAQFRIQHDATSPVDYTPWLHSPLPKAIFEDLPLLRQAFEFRLAQRYAEAESLCQYIVTEMPDDVQAIGALAELLNVFRENRNNNIALFCDKVRESYKPLRTVATQVLWKMRMLQEDYATALALAVSFLEESTPEEDEKMALVDMFHIYFDGFRNHDGAARVLEEMQRKYPDDIDVHVAEMSLDDVISSFPRVFEGEPTVQEENSKLPSGYKLAQNYPNPFNPETHISFQLPSAAHTSLKIYNVLGQEVRTLVDEPNKGSGYYTVTWDGKDYQGQDVSSGVYFYRLQAGGEYTETKKMVLMR